MQELGLPSLHAPRLLLDPTLVDRFKFMSGYPPLRCKEKEACSAGSEKTLQLVAQAFLPAPHHVTSAAEPSGLPP